MGVSKLHGKDSTMSNKFRSLYGNSVEVCRGEGNYRYSLKIYKYSMRLRVPAVDQSDCSICYNNDLMYFNRKLPIVTTKTPCPISRF